MCRKKDREKQVEEKIAPAEPQEVIKKESTTDSECGLFVKGEHERCFAYSAQTACDKHGFVLAFEVGAGNLHDGQMFYELYKKMDLSQTQVVEVDAGYKTPCVVREIFLSGKIPAVPYTRPMTKDGFFRKGCADKKLDSGRSAKMFTPEEKEKTLKLYEKVKSVTAVIQRLGYPTRQTFYQWLREKNNPVNKIKPPRKRINNSPDHPLHPSPELKLETLRRCFE